MGRAFNTHGAAQRRRGIIVEFSAGNPEEMGLLGRHRFMWGNTIKMDHKDMGFNFMDWIHLAQEAEEGSC